MHISEYYSCLMNITETINNAPHMEQVFHVITHVCRKCFECDTVAIMLIKPETEYLIIKNSIGLSNTFIKNFKRKIGTGTIGQIIWEQSPLLIMSMREHPEIKQDLKLENDFQSAICVPIVGRHKSLGILYCDSRKEQCFTMEDLRFTQVCANLIVTALDKEESFEIRRSLTVIDPETGVLTYHAFYQRILEELIRARVTNLDFSLILLDVDNFKAIRDTYGWKVGEKILSDVAKIIKAKVKGMDIIARYGYDELIAAVMRTNLEQGKLVAERLRKEIEGYRPENSNARITASFGVTNSKDKYDDILTMMVDLQTALFQAQRQGRNRVIAI